MTHHNRVYMENHNSSRGCVAGCDSPPFPSPPTRPLSACAEILANTTVAGSYEHDIRGLSAIPVATAEECQQLCASNSMCSSGEWYLGEIYPGPTQPNTPPRHLQPLCNLYHSPAAVDGSRIGQSVGHSSFNCSADLIPYVPTRTDYGLEFEAWMKMGLDEGSTIAEIPSVPSIIAMGMSTLAQDNGELSAPDGEVGSRMVVRGGGG